MPKPVVDALFDCAPIFANCTSEDREALWKVALEVRYSAGDEIVAAGGQSSKLFVLAEGTVEVVNETADGEESPLSTLIPPCSFGEVAFFEQTPNRVTARALTDVHVLALDFNRFISLLTHGDLSAYKVALNVLLKLGRRFEAIDAWVTEKVDDEESLREEWNAFRAQLYADSESAS